MNGGKPCEGNDTETARSCFAPCPGMSFVKKKQQQTFPPLLSLWGCLLFIHLFILFFSAKNCSEINFIEVQKNALKLNIVSFQFWGYFCIGFKSTPEKDMTFLLRTGNCKDTTSTSKSIFYLYKTCQVDSLLPLTPLKSLNKAGREGEGFLKDDKEQNISLVLTAAPFDKIISVITKK